MFNLRPEVLDRALVDFQKTAMHPFSHTVIPDFLPTQLARECAEEFRQMPDSKFVHYCDPDFEFEKYTLNKIAEMPPKLRGLFEHLHSAEMIATIEKITGLSGLVVDESRWGGGLHQTKPGGYLAVHKDFSVLPTTFKANQQLLRTINIIGYLSETWTPEAGGDLELWDKDGSHCEKKISPQFNHWAIFDTRGNFHGHPNPYRGKSPRYSIAAYYYLEQEVEKSQWHSTTYLRLPWREETQEYRRKREERASAELRYKGLL